MLTTGDMRRLAYHLIRAGTSYEMAAEMTHPMFGDHAAKYLKDAAESWGFAMNIINEANKPGNVIDFNKPF